MSNTMWPKVSVIIPCFNCQNWIEKCLDAIVNQHYDGHIEIICVDDNSKDNTRTIIKQYYQVNQRRSIVLIENEKNIGPGKSRNKGIQNSTGEWVSFCDADDWYDEYYISTMILNTFENDSDLVMCNYNKIMESSGEVITVDYLNKLTSEVTKDELIVFSKASLCLLLMRRELISKISIPDFRNGEDIAIVPILEVAAHKISYAKEPLYNYLIRRESASNKITKKVFYSLCDAYRFICDNLDDQYLFIKEYLGIRTILYGATMNAFKAGIDKAIIKDTVQEFTTSYPHWYMNKYIGVLSRSKRLYLSILRIKWFAGCKILATLHERMSV